MNVVPAPSCAVCGKNFSTDDLRGTNCRHCGTALPHHARAAQQVAVVQQMMADRNGNGVPDAFEPMVQNAQRNAVAYGPLGSHGAHGVRAQQAVVAGAGAAAVGIALVFVVAAVVIVVGAGVAFFLLAR